ncbi:MAG: PPC domain-containing protein [Nitrospirales bacterium]
MFRKFIQIYVILFLAWFISPLYAADIEIPLKAGAVDQQITVTFQNPTFRDIQDLKIRITQLPGWAEKASLSHEMLPLLEMGDSIDVTLTFDVKAELDENVEGNIELAFSLDEEQGELDTYRMTVGPAFSIPRSEPLAQEDSHCPIEKERSSGNWTGPEQNYVFTFYDIQSSKLLRILILTSPANGFVEIAKQSTKDQRYGPFGSMSEAEAQARSLCGGTEPSPAAGLPVFILAEITAPRSSEYGVYQFEYDGKSTGYVQRWGHKRKKHFTEQASVITQYPKRIVLGEPFSYTVSGKRRVDNKKFCVRRDKKPEMNTVSIGLRSPISTVEVSGRKNLLAFCEEAGEYIDVRGTKVLKTVRSMSKSDEIRATLTFVPTKVVRDEKGRPIEFFYRPQVSANGEINTYKGLEERRFYSLGPRKVAAVEPDGFFRNTDSIDSIFIGIIDLKLRYKPALRSSQPLHPSAFSMPEGLGESSSGPEPMEPVSRVDGQEGESAGDAGGIQNQERASGMGPIDEDPFEETSSRLGPSSEKSSSSSEEDEIVTLPPEQPPDLSAGDEPIGDLKTYPTSGPYTTTEGEMTFLESGILAARYHQDGGRLVGGFDGLVFTGMWVESHSKRKCPSQQNGSAYWGKVRFTFTKNFDAFKGVWGYCEDVPTKNWDGHRKRGIETRNPDQEPFSSTYEEQEPNNSLNEAPLVALPVNLQGSIEPKGEADWYKIHIEHQGVLQFSTSHVPPSINLALQVWNGEKKLVRSWITAKKSGDPLTGEVDLALPGTYYLEVRDGHNNSASQETYRLHLLFIPTKDTGELNNTRETATPLSLGQAIQANILPRAEPDWYQIIAETQGALEVAITSMPSELNITFQVFGPEKVLLRSWITPPKNGEDLMSVVDLPEPGTYYLEVRDGHNNARSITPYTLRATLTPTKDTGELNNTRETATPLLLGQAIQANILPKAEADWYRVQIPSAGFYNVNITNMPQELDVAFQVIGPEQALLRSWISPSKIGQDNLAVVQFPGPGTYYLELRDGHNNARSIKPYTLTILPPEQVQISESIQKAIGRGETFGRSSRPNTREAMIIGSGSMYSGDPQVEFIFLRATHPRPDGSRDYRLILGTPCKGCKDPMVYFNRAREAAKKLLQENSEKSGENPKWSMAMIGSLQDYCSYIATFSHGIPRGVSQVGWIKACGWPKTGWK